MQSFEFAIGPVQAFIAASRKTRDLSAGSFLLAWLATIAAASATKLGARIVFPAFPDNLADAMADGTAWRGDVSVPNRFRAHVDDSFGQEQADSVVCDVRAAWLGLANAVWTRDVLPSAKAVGLETQVTAIWKRQCENFWEIAWTIGPRGAPGLDNAKHWRRYWRPAEPGVGCSLLPEWQELSGASRRRVASDDEPFWEAMRQRTGDALRRGERLCAPALIRRCLSQGFAGLKVTLPRSGLRVAGTDLGAAVPSHYRIAAAPWLSYALARGAPALLGEATAKLKAAGYREERPAGARWQGVKAGEGLATPREAHQFAALDAAAFYAGRLAAPDGPPLDPVAVGAAAGALRGIGLGLACPFYVILRADIDSLGTLIRGHNESLSALKARAVARFGRRARRALEALGALVVYSGGDDLLAFAPARVGLEAAAAVRRQAAFMAARLGDEGIEDFTVSVAVLFAHLKTPLAAMLEASRRLLADEAKEAAGRDAVAIEVHKRGGKPLRWRRPWERAVADRRRWRLQLAELADKARFSSGFLYRLAPMLAGNVVGMGPDVVKDIAWALYLRSPPEDDRVGPALGRNATDDLVDQCRECRRLMLPGARAAHFEFTDRYEPDAALIVRFVAELDSAGGDD